MHKPSKLIINGKHVDARPGETLIDAALGAWLLIPSDCRSGQCESCRVTVVSGNVDDAGTAVAHTVLACQARVQGDAEIRFDELPLPVRRTGVLSEVTPLSPEVVQVILSLDEPLQFRPGQYVRAKFSGYPAREYSPTFHVGKPTPADQLVLHIRILQNGVVSGQIGTGIKIGHRVHVQGAFGTSYLHVGDGPLVLVSGGAGWAPIWALARAAREKQRHRELVVIAGSRSPETLYMRPALEWLRDDGVVNVFATVENSASYPLLEGRPHHYLPLLGVEDTVYVAGPEGLVDRIRSRAKVANAQFFADPFLPSRERPSLIDYMRRLVSVARRSSSASMPS